jgi:DNA-3-methyladenine glycosylase
LGVGMNLNKADLCGGRLWLEDPPGSPPRPALIASPRVGVDYAGKWAAKPWRFRETKNS